MPKKYSSIERSNRAHERLRKKYENQFDPVDGVPSALMLYHSEVLQSQRATGKIMGRSQKQGILKRQLILCGEKDKLKKFGLSKK